MTILGIDISKWDGDWNAVKAKQAGATFVFIKASQATFTDPCFINNWQKAKEAGLIRGAYHYLDYTKPAIDQANYFADLLKDDPGDLPPVIDYEQSRTDNDPSIALSFLRDSLDQLVKRTELFMDALVKVPMIYTGPGFWAEYGDQTRRDYWLQFPLWLAHWTTSSTPIVPPPWTMWQFWQYTSKGPGETFGTESLSVDMNRYNGTLNELMEFSGMRIPVINLNEKVEVLEGRVNSLADTVASLNQSGDTATTGIFTRVDNLEDQFGNFDASLTNLASSLTQRISVLEQQLTGIGTAAPVATIPANESPVGSGDAAGASMVSDPGVLPSLDAVGTGNQYAVCITSALNVRGGPAVSNPAVAILKYGQRVKVVNRQGGWAQLEDPAGWSSEAYLSFEQTSGTTSVNLAAPAIGSTPVTSTQSYGICNTSGLNVRSGPGVTYPIVGGLTYGQRVKIIDHQNGWAQIENPAGWSNETYLSFA